MKPGWRAALVLVTVVGIVAATLCGIELLEFVPRGTWIGPATDAERWLGIGVGMALQPFVFTALRHGRLRVSGDTLEHLGLGPLCRTVSVSLRDVRDWRVTADVIRGRRRRSLVLEMRTGTQHAIRLDWYADAAAALALVEAKLGPTRGGPAS